MTSPAIRKNALERTIRKILAETPLTDIHTHLYDPAMGPLLLWGIDDLLTYHYLVAEAFRARPDLDYDAFWALEKREKADLIWEELFVKRSPVSEACRGVLTVLDRLGLNPRSRTLAPFRRYFAGRRVEDYVQTVLETANIARLYMTNDPLDPEERAAWERGFARDPRFLACLRLDSAVMGWPAPVGPLRALGYRVEESLSGGTLAELKRYLHEWSDRIDARYMAISLPPSFRYPDELSPLTTLLAKAVFPAARERGIPAAMMIGVKKLVNPRLRLAGDSVGKAQIETVERIAADFGENRFLVTMLARENAHELCVAARKFRNLLVFGCWWFLNNPSLVAEITSMRLEMLGLSFIPQHSDARVLDQLVYKWEHSRDILARVLAEKYAALADASWKVSAADIRRDVRILFPAEV